MVVALKHGLRRLQLGFSTLVENVSMVVALEHGLRLRAGVNFWTPGIGCPCPVRVWEQCQSKAGIFSRLELDALAPCACGRMADQMMQRNIPALRAVHRYVLPLRCYGGFPL